MVIRRQFADGEHPGLVWVIVDGDIRHVSEFSRLAVGARPNTRCPQCDRRLILKLGRVLRHHAAHTKGVHCAISQPETLRHLNTKLGIAKKLRDACGSGSVLRTLQCCAGGRAPCDKLREAEWLRDWDEVLVEYRIGNSRRPDIVLRARGQDVGAIEIVVTHSVSLEKESALSRLGVAWIEVAADPEVDETWSVESPLPVIRTSETLEWRCLQHEEEHRATMTAVVARHAEQDEAVRHTEALRAARVVDVYRPSGSRTRLIYRVDELRTDGVAHTVVLRLGRLAIASVPLLGANDDRTDAWSVLRSEFARDVERQTAEEGAFMDSPMHWARGSAAANIVEEALSDMVGRDPTPLATRFPRRWFFARERGAWFLAPAMRKVRWDRDADDIFAPHPAWAIARQAVRERPAPPGSWDTPVFAARPLAVALIERSAAAIVASRQYGEITLVEVRTGAAEHCTLLVVERSPTASAIAAASAGVDERSIKCIWLAHPSDFASLPADATWVPAGRDARGKTVVSIDGTGVFRADQFVRAIATNDRRVNAAAITRQMSDRVARLRAAADTSR